LSPSPICKPLAATPRADPALLTLVRETILPRVPDSPDLAALAECMVRDSRLSRAAGTWRAYDPLLRQWAAFCAQHRVPPLGAPPEVAALFLTQVRLDAASRKIGPGIVEKTSAAISTLHEVAGLPSPCAGKLCSMVRETARRTLSSSKLDREDVTSEDIKQLLRHHLSSEPVSLRTRITVTCAAVAFAGLLRYSDLCRVMVHHDLMRFYADGVELYLFTSKTDQHCEGALVPIGRVDGPHCPVRLLESLLREGRYKQQPAQTTLPSSSSGPACLADTEDVGPLLRATNRKGTALVQVAVSLQKRKPVPIPSLTYGTFLKSLKEHFAAAGVQKQIGTHSLRKGGASAAVANGADRIVVQKLGRWRSPAVFEYIYVQESTQQQQRIALCMGLSE
jgi:hypothetical protein